MAVSTSPIFAVRPAKPSVRHNAAVGTTSGNEVLFGCKAMQRVAGEKAAYWRGFLEQDIAGLIVNLRTRAGVIEHEGSVYPVTINERPENNAYPCSLCAQYITYPLAEMELVKSFWLRMAAQISLHTLKLPLWLGEVDKVVQWNSWLLSTNLLSAAVPSAVGDVTARLVRQFPQHAILLKNVNAREYPELLALLEKTGYELITSRQVYFFDGRKGDYLSKSTVKRDRKFLKEQTDYQPMEHADFTFADIPRVAELYRQLYLEKYSQLNPQYTEWFVAGCIRERWLELRGLRHVSGRIDGVFGCFRLGGTTSTPFIGYDTRLPQETGLYRLLVTMLLTRVAEEKLLLNYSSGAGEFKRRRGAEPVIEFNAVYTRHLPMHRRAPFALLGALTNRFGRRFLEENQI